MVDKISTWKNACYTIYYNNDHPYIAKEQFEKLELSSIIHQQK